MAQKERWRAIAGFENYEVSNLGRIHRFSAKKFLKPAMKCRYLQVCLRKNRKSFWKSVHRLVAQAFVSNPLSLPQVNHLGPKTDCRAIKLEWRTRSGNTQHAVRNGIACKGDGVTFAKHAGKWVARYSPEPNKRKHIGYFTTEQEAKNARNKALKKLPNIL